MQFDIKPLSEDLLPSLQNKIDQKTKPIGALGTLEVIARQIGQIQNTLSPTLTKPTILVFAGDHGIAARGEVNPYPQAVTQQMVYNFLNGGAAINVFCKQNQIDLKIIDAGVHHDFENIPGLIHAKIDSGTKNYQEQPAMTPDQCSTALIKGKEIAQQTISKGCTILGFGEMGIGNSSAAALIMAAITNITIKDCIGAGTGAVNDFLTQKKNVLEQVYNSYNATEPLEVLATFGGFEIAMITGAILEAAASQTTILIDGFIVTAALLVAYKLYPAVLDYCIFAHTSNEQGHQKMLDYLGVTPVLNLEMRLGEGTGTAIAFPIIQAAVQFLNEMASFEDAKVSES